MKIILKKVLKTLHNEWFKSRELKVKILQVEFFFFFVTVESLK